MRAFRNRRDERDGAGKRPRVEMPLHERVDPLEARGGEADVFGPSRGSSTGERPREDERDQHGQPATAGRRLRETGWR